MQPSRLHPPKINGRPAVSKACSDAFEDLEVGKKFIEHIINHEVGQLPGREKKQISLLYEFYPTESLNSYIFVGCQ